MSPLGIFTPPVLFRGGDTFRHKTLTQDIIEELDKSNPMGWMTDNPERATRITQLSSEIQTDYLSWKVLDKDLFHEDLHLALEELLKNAGLATAEAYLDECRKQVDDTRKKEWDTAVKGYENHEWWVKFLSFTAGTLGTDFILKWSSYPEQATLKELGASVFCNKEATTINSLSAFARDWYSKWKGGPGLVPKREPLLPSNLGDVTEREALEAEVAALESFEKREIAILAAEQEIAFGSRLAARIGGVLFDIVGATIIYGVVDTIDNACRVSTYKQMEEDALISRLTMRRNLEIFKCLHDMITAMRYIQGQLNRAYKPENKQHRDFLLQSVKEDSEKTTEVLLEKIEKTTYSKIFKTLAQEDKDMNRYTKDTFDEKELIDKAIKAVSEQMKKDKHM